MTKIDIMFLLTMELLIWQIGEGLQLFHKQHLKNYNTQDVGIVDHFMSQKH